MYYQEMNSISFKASVQILYIVLCNYCTTCIIYRDKIKFKLNVIGSGKWPNHASCRTSPDVNEPYAHPRCAPVERLIFSTITRCYDKRVTVFAVAIVAGDIEVLYGKFT